MYFEYELDDLLSGFKVENVSPYDSKSKFAFYDIADGKLKSFGELVKPLSIFTQRQFYIIDENTETANTKYDVVFDLNELIRELKKKALQSLFEK